MDKNSLFRATVNGNLVMIAPLTIIAVHYQLHPQAESRIIREVQQDGVCKLHMHPDHNGKARFVIDVTEAKVLRGTFEPENNGPIITAEFISWTR